MGLLQFVKDAGEKLFNRGEAKAAEPAPMQAASTPGPVLKRPLRDSPARLSARRLVLYHKQVERQRRTG